VIRPLEDCEELGDAGIVCHEGYVVYDVDHGCLLLNLGGSMLPKVWQCTPEFNPGGYTYTEFRLIGCIVNDQGEKKCQYDNGERHEFAGRTYCTDDCVE
jgi:hypothetical protein